MTPSKTLRTLFLRGLPLVLAGATLMSCVAPQPPPQVAVDDDDGDAPDTVAEAPAAGAAVVAVRPALPPPAIRVGIGIGPIGVAVGTPGPRRVVVLPAGARRVWYRHHRVWVCNGVYYRRRPGGYVVVHA